MPVPAPNLYPEFNVIRLSHLCLDVQDLVASKRFYVDTLGLQVSHENQKNMFICARWKNEGIIALSCKNQMRPERLTFWGLKLLTTPTLAALKPISNPKDNPQNG